MPTPFKKFVVVKYDCKEYANRLWNDLSIYAMGLELTARIQFPPLVERLPLTRPLYEVYAQFVGRVLHKLDSVWAWGGTVKYLPPTEPLSPKYDVYSSLHFFGMLFRNPVGLEKYASELRTTFGPSRSESQELKAILKPLTRKKLIGIEIRQQAFTYFPEGEFLIPLRRTREIVDEYLQNERLAPESVGLVITSDAPLKDDLFSEFAQVVHIGSGKRAFQLLASTSVIIGTNSSRSNLPAWFQNVPHIVTTEEKIDWKVYEGKTEFFQNPYATFTQKISVA